MTASAAVLRTPRLRLVPATDAIITAELDGPDQLAEVLHAAVPPDWPPEHHDIDTLAFWRDALSQSGAEGWWLHYALLTTANRPTLVGSIGYKGPPIDGVVEIGYSVVPSWQRRGLATEACRALIESAWRRGAGTVVAHTLEGLEPSIGVLRKLGFAPADSLEPGVLAFALRRPERWPDVM
jgi:RimJ/RimL family protein N-acetyltransferase